MYMAVLVSGSSNGVMVFDWRARNKPTWCEWFTAGDALSPSVGNTKIDKCPQVVTQISFNPATINRIIMSGPNSHLFCYKIDTFNSEFQRDGDGGGFLDVISKLGEETNITHHCWDSDAQYLAVCTDEGHIIVKRIGLEIEYAEQFPNKVFVNVNLNKLGLIAASRDGSFYFFEHLEDYGQKEFKCIRSWQFFDPILNPEPPLA